VTPPARHDERYYEVVRPRSPAERLVVAARDRIYADFLRLIRPQAHETILDVGVSDVVNDAANMLERKDANPARITAAGLGEGSDFRAAFPQVAYRQVAANARLPFEDGQFDIAMSNAVIEHTGSRENQRFFVAELARVARRVFISAPNRYFPVEHHTAAPLLHYWRPTFGLFCRALGKDDWLDPENLILIGRRDLERFAPPGRRALCGYTGVRLGPFSSNMYLALDPA
jgi:hypothetical protein